MPANNPSHTAPRRCIPARSSIRFWDETHDINLSCPAWDLPRIIDAAVANKIGGIDFRGLGAEIDITRLPEFDVRLDETMNTLRRRGLSMPCLNTSVTLVSPAAGAMGSDA